LSRGRFSIPAAEYQNRLVKTRERLRSEGYSGLLAFSGYGERDGNICYLCGHKNAFPYSPRSEQVSGLGYSALLVPTEGATILVSPLGFQANRVVGVDRTRTGTNLTMDLVGAVSETWLQAARVAVAGADVIPAVYMDELRRQLPEIKFDYNEKILADQRLAKSENELRLMKHASKIADTAMTAAIESIKPGLTESAVGTVVRRAAMEAGADYVVRDRVQSGAEMGRLRWPFASPKKIRRGELVSLDLVGWAGAYGFDILRIGCAGRPNKQQRRLIEVAAQATDVMSESLTDGAEIEASISPLKQFERNGFAVSAFGHGIGLEIVENPYLFPGVTGRLRKNMVLCIEPDVRWKRGFASIENEVVVGSGKPEVLTKLPIFWD
jgi:Xaa-Pro aminopeptidase